VPERSQSTLYPAVLSELFTNKAPWRIGHSLHFLFLCFIIGHSRRQINHNSRTYLNTHSSLTGIFSVCVCSLEMNRSMPYQLLNENIQHRHFGCILSLIFFLKVRLWFDTDTERKLSYICPTSIGSQVHGFMNKQKVIFLIFF